MNNVAMTTQEKALKDITDIKELLAEKNAMETNYKNASNAFTLVRDFHLKFEGTFDPMAVAEAQTNQLELLAEIRNDYIRGMLEKDKLDLFYMYLDEHCDEIIEALTDALSQE